MAEDSLSTMGPRSTAFPLPLRGEGSSTAREAIAVESDAESVLADAFRVVALVDFGGGGL